MRRDDAAPAVVLSPHLDDAVLSVWSVLKQQDDVEILNVFTSVPRPGFATRCDRVAGATESAAFMSLRMDEDRQALAVAGRQSTNLAFLDEQYRDQALSPADIAEAIASHISSASNVFGPAALGGHGDHELVRDVALAFANHGVPVELYADLPYAIRYGWPHWVLGMPADPYLKPEEDWRHFLEPLTDRLSEPRIHAFSDAQSDEKLDAMKKYRTQFPSLNSGIIGRLANPAVRRYEAFWAVER